MATRVSTTALDFLSILSAPPMPARSRNGYRSDYLKGVDGFNWVANTSPQQRAWDIAAIFDMTRTVPQNFVDYREFALSDAVRVLSESETGPRRGATILVSAAIARTPVKVIRLTFREATRIAQNTSRRDSASLLVGGLSLIVDTPLHAATLAAMKKRPIGICERFGFAVKDRREELGLTQEDLADRASIHRTYLSDVERGTRNVSLINVERIAAGLKLRMSELFRRIEQP